MSRGLLLDEMISPQVAEALAKRGHDVRSVAGEPDLAGTPDEQLLDIATSLGRCLVTENVKDFEKLRHAWTAQGKPHAGLLYLSRHRFPRDRKRLGRLITALDRRLATGEVPGTDQVAWLS